MRTPISGIVLGFRIIKGAAKDASDYGKLFIVQAADKDHDADLIPVYVQEIDAIDYLLKNYSNGQLRWIDVYCNQVASGREMVWMLEKIFSISTDQIYVEGVS
jgi:hypothetical protein